MKGRAKKGRVLGVRCHAPTSGAEMNLGIPIP